MRLLHLLEMYTSPCVFEMLFLQSVTFKTVAFVFQKLDEIFVFGLFRKMFLFLDRKLEEFTFAHFAHPFNLFTDPDEDEWMMSVTGMCQLFGLVFPNLKHTSLLFKLINYDESMDPVTANLLFTFYRDLLKRHVYFHGTHLTYVAKNPTFTLRLKTILKYFPNSKVIVCVRDPKQAIPSMVGFFGIFFSKN